MNFPSSCSFVFARVQYFFEKSVLVFVHPWQGISRFLRSGKENIVRRTAVTMLVRYDANSIIIVLNANKLMTNSYYQLNYLSETLTQRKLTCIFLLLRRVKIMGSSQSKEEKKFKSQRKNTKEKQVSAETSSSVESDSVSYSTETNSSSSDRPTTTSDYSNVDSLGYPIEQENVKTNGCCLKCECYCDCGRDCTDNCCCRCMKDTICCLMSFFFTLLKYFLLFCIYVLVTCVIICCPPLWILLCCSRGSRGLLRCAIWRNLLGGGGE